MAAPARPARQRTLRRRAITRIRTTARWAHDQIVGWELFTPRLNGVMPSGLVPLGYYRAIGWRRWLMRRRGALV